MRVLIKQNESELFFQLDPARWTSRDQATEFSSASQAIAVCLRRSLTDTTFLVRKSANDSEVEIPFE